MKPANLLPFFILLFIFYLSGCTFQPDHPTTAYTGVTLWTGNDQGLIDHAALVVRQGTIIEVIDLNQRQLPEDVVAVDLSGRYIIPGLINAHGHVGMAKGLETGPSVYSRENVIDQLRLYARYGITTVVSLGDEPPQAFEVRHNEDPAELRMARLWLSGPVLDPQNPEEARRDVDAIMIENPDWTKIRVDDNLGRSQKMSRETSQAVIEASHEYGIPHASHIVTLQDAKDLVRNHTDLIAHSVRDEPVDQELIDLMRQAGICITPTLTREISTFIYADRPDFFDDPFFLKEADPAVVEQLQRPEVQQGYHGTAPDYYRQALPLARENMMALHKAGVPVALGTDSGPPGRFQGYFEHMEMELMQESGMAPEEVLLSATSKAAQCMGIADEVGSLEAGKQADFLVLEEDPLQSVRNLRNIEAVFIGGEEVPIDN